MRTGEQENKETIEKKNNQTRDQGNREIPVTKVNM